MILSYKLFKTRESERESERDSGHEIILTDPAIGVATSNPPISQDGNELNQIPCFKFLVKPSLAPNTVCEL